VISLQELLVDFGRLEIFDFLDVDLDVHRPALVLLAEVRLGHFDGRGLLVAGLGSGQQLIELGDRHGPDEAVRPDVNLGVVQLVLTRRS
jgi:hypothetical protein